MAEDPAVTYATYLALDDVLGAQHPRSDEHDELLFIVIHQVYELWFKQLLHELRHAQTLLEAGALAPALHTLGRIVAILKVAVAQVDVLETMTPRQFAGFRGRLEAASGFQSAQFRELEAVLGDRRSHHQPGAAGERIVAAQTRASLYDSFLGALQCSGYPIPPAARHRDVSLPTSPSPAVQDVLVAVYRDNGVPAELCERLVDLDEGLQEWRFRHVKMVERTIGDRRGTGGSSGAAYLRTTLFTPLFPDLWAVRSRL